MKSITSKLSIIILSLLASTFALAQVTQMTDNNVGNGLAVEENTDFTMPADSENAEGEVISPSDPAIRYDCLNTLQCKAEGMYCCVDNEGEGSVSCCGHVSVSTQIIVQPTCPTGDTCP